MYEYKKKARRTQFFTVDRSKFSFLKEEIYKWISTNEERMENSVHFYRIILYTVQGQSTRRIVANSAKAAASACHDCRIDESKAKREKRITTRENWKFGGSCRRKPVTRIKRP